MEPQLRRVKRLPLSSTSAQHNKPRTPSSPTKLQAPSAANKVVRSVKSNPSLPRQARPPPPPLGTFPSSSTATSSTSSSSIPHSPSYPLPNSEEAASLQRLAAPAGVTFGKELFLHRHERDFPHLYQVVPPKVVRKDTPASAISSEEASVVMGGGAGSPEAVEEKKEDDDNDQEEELSTPRRKVRPLSLVILQPSGGLFSPKDEEMIAPASRPTSVVERLVEREKERESLDLDRRSSDEISSECDLDFVFDHTNNTPPPPPRFKARLKPTTTTSSIPRPAFNAAAAAPPPLAVKFASSTTAGDHHRRPFAPPPACLTPSTSGSSSSYALPLGPNVFPSLPPTPDTASYPFPSPPPAAATSRRPLPTNPSLGGHRRGPSITYRRSSAALVSPPISSTLSPAPSVGDLAPGAMSTSASNSTMTSTGSIRVPRRMTSVEMERELFWHPSMVEEQLESMHEENEGFGRAGTSSSSVKGKERDEGERPGIGGAKRLGSGSSLVRKSASEGVGLRERYQEVENRNQSTTSLYGSTPNTPNSPYGFIHNPTPPSIHFNAPSSDAGSSRSSWRDWFGGSSSSRRGSEIKHSADVLERGEAGGSGTLRPGWMSRKGSLPLPSPSYSFVSSGSGSGSSFGNAPGEIWPPSSPSSPSYSPDSNGTFGPNSPQQIYSPSFPPGSDLRPPPQAVTIRRPLVSTSANATLAGGRSSPSLSQQPQPLHRGLKPLELTLPPRPLRKKAGGLFSASRAPLATIAGSPSKRDLEEGRGAGPSVEQPRSRTRSAPTRGSGSDQDENDENISPTPLEGYHLQSTHTPSSTPPRLRTRSGEPSFALAVHPSTPLRYPSPPSPSLGKTSDLPSHRRTYSTATSTTFSPSKSKGSISYRPHNAHLNLNPSSSNVLSSTTTETARRQSIVTFHDASSDRTAFTSTPSSGGLEHGSKGGGTASNTLFNSTSTTATSRDHGQGGAGTLVRPVSMLSMQSVYQRVMNAPRHWLDEVLPSQLIFMAGFLLGPWCWILGGWGLSSDGRLILTQLQGARPRTHRHLSPSGTDQRQQPRWGSASARRSSFNSDRSSIGGQRSGGWSNSIDGNEYAQPSQQQFQGQKWRTRSGTSVNGNGGRKKWLLPVLRSEGRDKWVWRCRVAAILSGCVFIPGLVLAVVFAAL